MRSERGRKERNEGGAPTTSFLRPPIFYDVVVLIQFSSGTVAWLCNRITHLSRVVKVGILCANRETSLFYTFLDMQLIVNKNKSSCSVVNHKLVDDGTEL